MALVDTGLHSEPLEDTAARGEIFAYVVLGTAILGAVAFRWLDLQRWSLWWDEGFTVWASGLPLGQIIPFARSDNQAPLYYLMQHYWGLFFGNSEFALRSLSALFGTLALPVFYLLAKRVLKDGKATALAFWLFAFSLRQIWYAREARTYTVASFFALVALYALVRFLEKRSAWAFVTVILSSTLTLYLHNMMFFYLLALNIVWLIYPSETAWTRRIPEMVIANVCMGVLYLPWGVTLMSQVAAVSGNLYWVARPTLENVARTVATSFGLEVAYLAPLVRKILPLPDRLMGAGLWLAVAVLCGMLTAAGFWRVSKTEARKNLCFLLYCLLPILLVLLLSLKMPLYIDRVFTTSSIAAPIIFAFPLAAQKDFKRRRMCAALAVAFAGLALLSSIGFIRSGEKTMKNHEDWRGVIDVLLAIPETNRMILFVPPAGEIFFDYYSKNLPASETDVARHALQEDFHSRFPPPKSRILNEKDIERLSTLVKSHRYSEIDLVLTHEVDPNGLIVDYLDRHFVRQQESAAGGAKIQVIPFRAVSRP